MKQILMLGGILSVPFLLIWCSSVKASTMSSDDNMPDSDRDECSKDSFLEAKESYDGSVALRVKYSRVVSKCLGQLIESGTISEEELGVAPSLEEGKEVPFLPLDGPNPASVTVNIKANSGPLKIPGINQKVTYKNWVITGLYAPPGKIITVVSPEIALTKFKIKIGSHTDKFYKKEVLIRDPAITMDFSITKGTQAIGSPYGGLIFILFNKDNGLEGEIFEIKFENVLEAPHFVLGKHTNDDWNNHIKSEAIPWTMFEIPNKIVFIVPSRGENGAYQLDDVTTNLEEWSSYMEKNDKAAGISNRPTAEIIVIDSQILVGGAHNGYPIMKQGGKKVRGIQNIFPKKKTINDVNLSIGLGHEIGHNMQLTPYLLSHVCVNLIYNYALPETRKGDKKCGTWGRGSRLFSYIKAGKSENLATSIEHNYDIWAELLKIPFDGLDGSGWKNDGSWNDLPVIFASYRDLPPGLNPSKEERMDLWVKTYCNVKKMNMLSYFDFWKFPITSSTRSTCQQYSTAPTEIMSWITNIERMANEEDACSGDDWFGYSKKCFKITKGKYTNQAARDYCAGLDGSTALASITSQEDAMQANFAYFKSKFNGVWIEGIADPAEVFPYDVTYNSEIGKQVILGHYSARCHYKATVAVLNGKTKNCIGPRNESPEKKFFALCEKNN